MCAPKGAAFVWVAERFRDRAEPPVVSHGYNATDRGRGPFRRRFDWQGTRDPSAWLSVPFAIEWMGSRSPGGWDEIRRRNRRLALDARSILVERTGAEPVGPESMIGSLVALRLPCSVRPGPSGDRVPAPPEIFGRSEMQKSLFDRYRIEVPVHSFGREHRLVRASAQLYNRIEQYERLGEALVELLAEERLRG